MIRQSTWSLAFPKGEWWSPMLADCKSASIILISARWYMYLGVLEISFNDVEVEAMHQILWYAVPCGISPWSVVAILINVWTFGVSCTQPVTDQAKWDPWFSLTCQILSGSVYYFALETKNPPEIWPYFQPQRPAVAVPSGMQLKNYKNLPYPRYQNCFHIQMN